MKTTYQTGLAGELQAEEWLIRNRGMKTLERRYRTKAGEIDLIMAEGNTVVFVEVKTRRNRVFTEPTAAVDYRKLQNLKRAINHYVKYHRIDNDIRLDIITVVGTPESGAPEIEHIIDVPII